MLIFMMPTNCESIRDYDVVGNSDRGMASYCFGAGRLVGLLFLFLL